MRKIYKECYPIVVAFLFLLLHQAAAQNPSNCPTPGASCTPFKGEVFLADKIYSNCDLIRPTMSLSSNNNDGQQYLFTWTFPDGSKSNSKDIVPKGPGKYTLCYDTASAIYSCPKTKTIEVTKEIKEQFAYAGPDKSICFGMDAQIGAPGDTTQYSYQWINNADRYFYGGSEATSSNPNVLVTKGNLSLFLHQQLPVKLYLSVTDKATMCRQVDTMTMSIYMPPLLTIQDLQPNYCVGETPAIALTAYYPTFVSKPVDLNENSFNLSLDTVPQTLSNVINDTLMRYDAFTDPNIRQTLLQSKKIMVNLPPGTHGEHTLNYSVTTKEGCVAKLEATTYFNGGNSGIEVRGLTKNDYCAKDESEINIKAYRSSSVEANQGSLTISPSSPALIKKDDGYYFKPSLAEPGLYHIVYKEEKQGDVCGSSGVDTVIIKKSPKPKIIGRNSVCLGAQDIMYIDTANYGPNVVKQWDITPNATINGSAAGDTISVNFGNTEEDAKITLVNDNGGCSADTSFTIKISNSLNATSPFAHETKDCISDSLFTYSSSYGLNYLHQWNVIGGVLSPDTSGYIEANQVKVRWFPNQPNYLIWVRDSVNNSCVGNSDTLKVEFAKEPLALIYTPEDTTACTNDTLLLTAAPSEGTTFTWKTISQKTLNSSSITQAVFPPFEKKYILIADKGPLCPQTSDTISIISQAPPAPALNVKDIFICFEDTSAISLVAKREKPGYHLLWNTLDTTETISVSSEGEYWVEQTDLFGCSSKSNVKVLAICKPKINVPTAFSPNGDGINDSLEVFSNNIENFLMTVYNRWGEVVYATTDRNKLWDGKINGSPAPIGLYPWVITVDYRINETEKEKVVKKGSISLVR